MKPTWQRIPIEVKEEIIQFLDFQSRFRLQTCSKSDKNLIDQCPIFLKNVEIYTTTSKKSVLHVKDYFGSVKIFENIFDHFFNVFKSKRTSVQSLLLDFSDSAVWNFLSKIQFLKYQIKAKSVYFKLNGVSDQDFLRIFNTFNARHYSFYYSLSEELLADLVKTKNWKNADQIFFYGRQEIPMDSVLHLNKIRFYTTDFTTIDAWNLIDSFITRQNLKPGFGFRVNFGTALSEDDVLEGFKNGTKHSNSSKIVILPTKSADLIFVVKMRRSIFGYQDLEGYVCNKDFKQDEFKKYSSWVPENHLQMTRRLQSHILPIPPWFLFVRSVVQASEQL